MVRGLGVFGEVGFYHLGVGAEFQGFEHGHGAVDAGEAGDVAGGADDAAGAAADNHRAMGEVGPVAFFDAGVEGVAIDMGDGEGEELGVP